MEADPWNLLSVAVDHESGRPGPPTREHAGHVGTSEPVPRYGRNDRLSLTAEVVTTVGLR